MSPARIWSVEGNRQLLDGGSMFGNVPRPVWEKWIAPDKLGRIPLACRCLLIEWDGKTLLCETGIGAFFEPKMAERFGVQDSSRHILRESLAAIGHPVESIDFVLLSHLHFDHAGGLLPTHQEIESGNQGLIFPNATFIVGLEAWERALQPHSRDRASFIAGLTDKLRATGRLVVTPRDPLPPLLTERLELITTSGHTPGQIHSLFNGQKGKAFFCGDLIPGGHWVHLPITMGYDRYPEMLIDEKSTIYARATQEDWLMFFTHDPNVAGGHIQKSSTGKFELTEKAASYVGISI